MPKISIVVPIYNKEQILHKCLDSLVNQTMQDIEIILINDGSTDNSASVCLDYVKKYPNLVQYHAFENGGVSKARNRGIDLAIGEYISFVDSDDWVALDFCEKMYSATQENKIDLVFCGIEVIDGGNSDLILPAYFIEDFKHYLNVNPIIKHSVSNKLFRLDVIRSKKINFIENVHLCEDLAFVFLFLSNRTTIATVRLGLYYYQKNLNSVTKQNLISPSKLNELFSVVDNVYNYLYQYHLYDANADHFRISMIEYILLNFASYIVRNYQLTNAMDKKKVTDIFFFNVNKYVNGYYRISIYCRVYTKIKLFATFPKLINLLKDLRKS